MITVLNKNKGHILDFSDVVINNSQLGELNVNMIRSHAVGTGPALTPERTRALLAVRINSFANGHAGISPENLQKCLLALNSNCLPIVPQKGTVGAHDLAQLAHLTLGLMGEGKMWSKITGVGPAAVVLKK